MTIQSESAHAVPEIHTSSLCFGSASMAELGDYAQLPAMVDEYYSKMPADMQVKQTAQQVNNIVARIISPLPSESC
jgi:hypothetical protein